MGRCAKCTPSCTTLHGLLKQVTGEGTRCKADVLGMHRLLSCGASQGIARAVDGGGCITNYTQVKLEQVCFLADSISAQPYILHVSQDLAPRKHRII